jgi:molybdate transport system permease protein
MGVAIGIFGPLRVAAISTAVSLAIGLWLAWLLVNRQFPGRREIGLLATAALALPAPVICYIVLFGPAKQAFWGVVSAGVLTAAPMVVRAGRAAFVSLDPGYAKVARSLGASDWRVFWRVEFPLVWRPIASATAVALARVFAEIVAAFLISARSLS